MLNGEHKQMICKKSVVSIALNLVPRMLELAFPYASRSQNFLHPTRRRALKTPIVTASYSTTTIHLLQILLKPLPFPLFFVVVVAVFASPQACTKNLIFMFIFNYLPCFVISNIPSEYSPIPDCVYPAI